MHGDTNDREVETSGGKPDFSRSDLLPAICQDFRTGEILMQAWTNTEAHERTLSGGQVWFFSRSRSSLWLKGETSGNFLKLIDFRVDCDQDTILYLVDPQGPACHRLVRTCFVEASDEPRPYLTGFLADLGDVLEERAKNIDTGKSYVASLLKGGIEACAAKVVEEAAEVVEAARNESDGRVVSESADVLFHLLVLLQARGLKWEDVAMELRRRHGVSGIVEKANRAVQGSTK